VFAILFKASAAFGLDTPSFIVKKSGYFGKDLTNWLENRTSSSASDFCSNWRPVFV
jgi:hypothetical protein